MKRAVIIAALLGLSLTAVVWYSHNQLAAASQDSRFPVGRIYECEKLSPSERAGCEIWYMATFGNDRFHSYVFQQRLAVLIDWYRVLQSKNRDQRFTIWGLINDPDCCQPGSDDCPAKSYEDTYGFDWCPGDEELLKFVGKPGYRDPACDFRDAPIAKGDPHGPEDKRESSCHIAFGTSTGAMGFRKFPNPRFDEQRWRKLNHGKLGTWAGYNWPEKPEPADYYVRHLADGSIEPPFLIGMPCGACHIAFDPLNPPEDPNHPEWENIKGLVGNQYTRMSEIFISGMPTNTLEWQVFSHSRPGTVDTSAVPNDQVNNAGTMNALINLHRRPVFEPEIVNRWRKVSSCEGVEPKEACWCEPGKPGKCWHKSTKKDDTVHHVLKGAGDSIGLPFALQRVYNNIGSCSEQCWVNHLTDLRQLDPQQRGFGQTPMDMGQCRRDCPNFRALEDRLDNLKDFVLSPASDATDLVVARANALKAKDPNARYEYVDLVEDLEKEFGVDAVARGKIVFAEKCARCHSSLPESEEHGKFKDRNYRAVTTKSVALGGSDTGRAMRTDWLGNDGSTKVSEVGTYRCRALHSNHMAGRIWHEFASQTYRDKPPDPNVKEPSDGGRGHYRNISLLNLWAHAPFMHNNAIGPELCNNRYDPRPRWSFYRSPYVDANGKPLPKEQQPACWDFEPSVEGRYALYKASMDLLLNPDKRVPKITMLDKPIVIDIGPTLWDDGEEQKLFGFTVEIPAGTPAGLLGNFQHKPFVVDLVQSKTKPKELETRLRKQLGDEAKAKKHVAEMRELADEIIANPRELLDAIRNRRHLLRGIYSSCAALIENGGHRFGEDLSDEDKAALTAFLATL